MATEKSYRPGHYPHHPVLAGANTYLSTNAYSSPLLPVCSPPEALAFGSPCTRRLSRSQLLPPSFHTPLATFNDYSGQESPPHQKQLQIVPQHLFAHYSSPSYEYYEGQEMAEEEKSPLHLKDSHTPTPSTSPSSADTPANCSSSMEETTADSYEDNEDENDNKDEDEDENESEDLDKEKEGELVEKETETKGEEMEEIEEINNVVETETETETKTKTETEVQTNMESGQSYPLKDVKSRVLLGCRRQRVQLFIT